jgi:flagellar FliJ protein
MSFRFALDPLLRLRRSLERQRILVLQKANLEVARAQDATAQLERYLRASDRAEAEGWRGGRSAAELQFTLALRENLLRVQRELRADLRRLEGVRQKAVGEYHQAYREREILESLRARQRRTYEQEQSRQEQQELDAAHLLQRWHRRG